MRLYIMRDGSSYTTAQSLNKRPFNRIIQLLFLPQRRALCKKCSGTIFRLRSRESLEQRYIRIQYFKRSRAILTGLALWPSLPTARRSRQAHITRRSGSGTRLPEPCSRRSRAILAGLGRWPSLPTANTFRLYMYLASGQQKELLGISGYQPIIDLLVKLYEAGLWFQGIHQGDYYFFRFNQGYTY